MFFESDRQTFFRPLTSSRRELVAACLRALFERLHGLAADYSNSLTRDALRDLLLPVAREHQGSFDAEAQQDEFSTSEARDPQQLTNLVIRALLRDGWLEQYPDRNGLVTAFRFSRPGKLFAEAFWSLDRPSRSRQRNMRGCRNALEAALSERGDAHDLVDAYEYAEKVIEDLTEGIEYIQERIRHLVQEASASAHWEDFVEFLDRFQRDYSKQLTADSATLNRQAIRQRIERLRVSVNSQKYKRVEAQLHDIAQWAVREHTGPSVFDWLLGRIEDLVNAACDTQQPTFVRSMDTYVRRITGLVQQAMTLRTGQRRHAYVAAINRLAAHEREQQDKLLKEIGERISGVEVRLLDPSSFKLRTYVRRQKASTIAIQPRASREACLAAFVKSFEAQVFAVANEELASKLRESLRLARRPIRLSEIPAVTARELVGNLQMVEAVRNAKGRDLVATKLPSRVDSEFYRGFDYEFKFKE